MSAFGARSTGETLNLGPISAVCKAVVVGIDFGTAYSGVAYAYKADPTSMKQGAPTALEATQTKVPTVILINNDKTFEFGYAAEAKYNEYLMAHEEGTELPGQLYKRFKMELKDKDSGFETIKAKSVAGKEHPVMDLVVKCLAALKDFAISRISSGYGAAVNPLEDVQWVLTVPAIWNDFGKAFMRRAAFLAELVPTEQSDNLMLVLEPEGAALAVHVGAFQHGLLGEGSRFMVLDCGGGTIDITTYEVRSICPLQLKAIAIPSGGAWGGEYVNVEFKKFLNVFLGPNLYKESESPYEFYTISCEFDKIKMLFDPSKDPASIRLIDVLEHKKQLVELAEAYNATHPDKPVLISPTLRNGFLTMSKELMLSFFEPCLKSTVEETKRVMRDNLGIRHIIVVGGFGSSRVLTERVGSEFHMKGGVNVVLSDPNPKPQGAIALGAVYFGLYKDIIQARLSPYTYGVAMRMNGEDERFSILVSKGEELPADHAAYLMGLPISPDQEKIVWRVYRSEKSEPTHVTGELLMGTVTALCPKNGDQYKRKQVGWYKFGGPEIRITIENAEAQKFEGEIKMT
jgi:hypothetical protein